MTSLPDKINTVEELENILAAPSEALIQDIAKLQGDIMILGAGGKIGPTMARRAKRAIDAAGVKKDVYGVDVVDLPELEAEGIKTIKCDMLDLAAVEKLPKIDNIIFMAGRKFGSTGSEYLTWAINVIVPYHVARTFTDSRIAAFSTGCVYPVMHVFTGGAVEADAPDPIGEYSMSCLGRERMFDFASETQNEKVVIIRLNYSVELRYGVLVDVANKVFNDQPVDVTTGFANVIWQGDACDQAIRSLPLADSPAKILNVTGPETFAIRSVAKKFATLFGKEAKFTGEENGMGYLNNAGHANDLFGYPQVSLDRIIQWTANWVQAGGENTGKPTHFETQDGKY